MISCTKAAVVCANEDVQYLDYEEPIPGPGEVKVKVRASGICGSDIPRVLHNGVHFYPIVLGHEFSGDVVEIGEGVTKVKVGDRVEKGQTLGIVEAMKLMNEIESDYSGTVAEILVNNQEGVEYGQPLFRIV